MNNPEQIDYLEAVEEQELAPKDPIKTAFVCGVTSISLVGANILSFCLGLMLFIITFVIAMILFLIPFIGIIPFIVAITSIIAGVGLALASAIFAIVGIINGKKALKLPEGKKSTKILALVFSIISLALAIIYFALFIVGIILVIILFVIFSALIGSLF